jgi:hypothetical protein
VFRLAYLFSVGAGLGKFVGCEELNVTKSSPLHPAEPTSMRPAATSLMGQQPTSGPSSRGEVSQISWSLILIDAGADRHINWSMAC